MSSAVTAVSSLTRASPRNCFRQWETAWSSSASIQAPVFSCNALPVGLTMRKLSMKASSIGPCRPWRLRRVPSSAAREDAVEPAVDLLLRLRVVAVRRLRPNDVNHADALGRERFGHQVGCLFLGVDLAAVSDRRAVEQVDGIVGAVVEVPELLLVP